MSLSPSSHADTCWQSCDIISSVNPPPLPRSKRKTEGCFFCQHATRTPPSLKLRDWGVLSVNRMFVFFNYFSFYYWQWLFPPRHVVLNRKELWHRGHTLLNIYHIMTHHHLPCTKRNRGLPDRCTILQHMLIFHFHSTTDHCCSEEHVEEHTPSLTSATSQLTTNSLTQDPTEVSGSVWKSSPVRFFVHQRTWTRTMTGLSLS